MRIAIETLLFLAPALLLAIPLLGGHYVGEELVAKLAAPRPRRRPRAGSARPRLLPALPSTWRPRGANLVAFSLAKRPPPAAPLPQN